MESPMTDDLTDIELASVSQVPGYQRRLEDGRVVSVRGYVRTDLNAVSERARNAPGRPSVAASTGSFPGGRAVPSWPDAGKSVSVKASEPKYEGISETGSVDQTTLDTEVPVMLEVLKNQRSNPSLKKLVQALGKLSTASLSEDAPFDPNVIELARGIVKVSGYSYVSKKTGKVVRVDPYSQIRSLISALGGPSMAARKGITPDLLDKALPGLDIKSKVFTAKKVDAPPTKNSAASRAAGKISNKQVAEKLNSIQVDRTFDVPKPAAGDNYMTSAMSASHPLAAVRNAKEGSTVTRGTESWVRATDGLWYKTPRRNNAGITDRALTKSIASRGGSISLTQGDPMKRKTFDQSKVDLDKLNPRSKNYATAVKYSTALGPSIQAMPEGVADSLNGHIEVRKQTKPTPHLSKVRTSKNDNYYPKLVVFGDPKVEADVIKSLPKQQAQKYSVPTTLHPMETLMARQSSEFVETLMQNRAPDAMTSRLYDKLSKAYDANLSKEDHGRFSGLSGREGWIARMTGERSEALRDSITDALSMSAMNSPEDFLAEAWTEFVGHPSPRPLARAMGQAFQDSMVEFSDYLFMNKWVDASVMPEGTIKRNIKPSVSRKISEVVGGVEDYTLETNLAPRDLRDVLTHSSRYVDIRDEDGNPLFDAEVEVQGANAYLATLSMPQTPNADMPWGQPLSTVYQVEDGARYYETPTDMLDGMKANQRRYADYVDQSRALDAIAAIEETLYSEGVRRVEVQTIAKDSSLTYAKAGYLFDPDGTDVQEIHTVLNNISDGLSSVALDRKEGYNVLPVKVQTSVRSKIARWQKSMTADPTTWPTPQEIARLGKLADDEHSIGETALDGMSWSGVKALKKKDMPKVIDDYPEVLFDAPSVSDAPSPSVIGATARAAISYGSTEYKATMKKAMTALGEDVLSRHQEVYPGATVVGRATDKTHGLSIKDADGNVLMSVTVTPDPKTNSLKWSGVTIKSEDTGAAIVAYDLADSLESAYQQTPYKTWEVPAPKKDTIGNFVMATSGFTWKNPPSRFSLEDELMDGVDRQVEARRLVSEALIVKQNPNADFTSLQAAMKKVDVEAEAMKLSLTKQVNAYLSKFDDPDGQPTPFELAFLGRREARQTKKLREEAKAKVMGQSTPDLNSDDDSSLVTQGGEGGNLPPNPPNAPASGDMPDDLTPEEREEWNREGTLLQQMFSIDDDALHDSFAEFLGKQALTMGTYAWFKTLEGYWDWATDSYNPNSRKYIAGLLFMLLRLLPASVGRGALLQVTNQLTRRIKSPRPEDWPSKAQIKEVMDDIVDKLPSDTDPALLNELEDFLD